MSLEWAEKIRDLRKTLNLSRRGLAELLDTAPSVINHWENLTHEPTRCWERLIQFLIDCPSAALNILRQKPWKNPAPPWSERIERLLEMLGWPSRRLAQFFDIDYAIVLDWTHSRIQEPSVCHQILLTLLEIYSETDPQTWPPALRFIEQDIMTPERVKLLRLSLGMKQSQLGDLLHAGHAAVSKWEKGNAAPSWCTNLLLRMLETYPRSVDLLEKITKEDEFFSPDRAAQARASLGLTALELGNLLGTTAGTIYFFEGSGVVQNHGCQSLVYRLLERYPEEFISYIKDLSSPGGQACPIW